MHVDYIVTRRSPVLLCFQMILVTGVVSFAMSLILLFLEPNITGPLQEALRDKLIFSGASLLLELLLIILLFLHWYCITYKISKGEVTISRGVLWTRQVIHTLKNVQMVRTERTVLGQIFHYGTVTMVNPLLQEAITLTFVPDPERYAEIIRRCAEGYDENTIIAKRS